MSAVERIKVKMADPEYRHEFVAAQVSTGLAFQIRALREQRKWTQDDLGARIGLKQSGISRLETPGQRYKLETLKKLAAAFDVALVVRFAPFSELARWTATLKPGALEVPSFSEDHGFNDSKHLKFTLPRITSAARVLAPSVRTVQTRHEFHLSVSPQGTWNLQPVPVEACQNV